jgi:hypothetical protein
VAGPGVRDSCTETWPPDRHPGSCLIETGPGGRDPGPTFAALHSRAAATAERLSEPTVRRQLCSRRSRPGRVPPASLRAVRGNPAAIAIVSCAERQLPHSTPGRGQREPTPSVVPGTQAYDVAPYGGDDAGDLVAADEQGGVSPAGSRHTRHLNRRCGGQYRSGQRADWVTSLTGGPADRPTGPPVTRFRHSLHCPALPSRTQRVETGLFELADWNDLVIVRVRTLALVFVIGRRPALLRVRDLVAGDP